MCRGGQEEDVDVLPLQWRMACCRVGLMAASMYRQWALFSSHVKQRRGNSPTVFTLRRHVWGSPLHPQLEIVPPPPTPIKQERPVHVRLCSLVWTGTRAAFSSASGGLAAEIRADNDNYTTPETRIGSGKPRDEVATRPNANFNLLTLLLRLLRGEQTWRVVVAVVTPPCWGKNWEMEKRSKQAFFY